MTRINALRLIRVIRDIRGQVPVLFAVCDSRICNHPNSSSVLKVGTPGRPAIRHFRFEISNHKWWAGAANQPLVPLCDLGANQYAGFARNPLAERL